MENTKEKELAEFILKFDIDDDLPGALKERALKILNKRSAQTVALYFEKYVNYLKENNLDDDADSISVENLIEFVESEILPNEEE